jgi:hypothetical protein
MILLLDCGGIVQTGWYLFARVSILTFSTIFLLDYSGNVQTGCYLFVRVSFCPFLRFFYWIEQSNSKIVEKGKTDSITNKYHPVWTCPPQSIRKIVDRVNIDTLTNKYHPVLFVRVSILLFSTIFLLDCGGNVQTGWYLFVRVSILTFSRLNISTTIY